METAETPDVPLLKVTVSGPGFPVPVACQANRELLFVLPVGTVYDPFVCRGLDAFIYSLYSGARFVIAGTPSGITLSAEGGAHQSTITSSIGL